MLSANEISGLVIKAARGAGIPFGCAQELGPVAVHLAQAGALGVLRDALACGGVVAEIEEGGTLTGQSPVMGLIAERDLRAAGKDVVFADEVAPELRSAFESSGPVPAGPFEVDPEVWAAFAEYAARTFVPETDASRLAGAGAGLTDND